MPSDELCACVLVALSPLFEEFPVGEHHVGSAYH